MINGYFFCVQTALLNRIVGAPQREDASSSEEEEAFWCCWE